MIAILENWVSHSSDYENFSGIWLHVSW